MRAFYIFTLCMVFGLTLISTNTLADETMDRIEKEGKIRVGWREGSIPFAYIDPETQKYIGFSVDMTYLLVDRLSERFGKKIEIEPHTVSAATRMPMVVNREIDVEMGSTTHTQQRDDTVDFSLIFFFSETTFLIPKNSDIKIITDLNGKRLGAGRGSTNLAAIRAKIAEGVFKPKGEILEVEDHTQGFTALQAKKIDAYCTDRSLLEGMRMKASNPENWKTVDFSIAYEPYGYMVWEGNSDIRDFIDNTIIWSIKTGKFYELYDKWMGPRGVVTLPISRAYRDYLNMISSYPQKKDWWKKP